MKLHVVVLSALLCIIPPSVKANPGEHWWEIFGNFITFDIPIPNTDGISLYQEGVAADVPDQDDPNKTAIEVSKFADQEKGGFDTADLIINTFEGVLDCIDYCVVGFQIRYSFPASIYFTPVWRHNNADFLVHTFPSIASVELDAIASLIPINLPILNAQDDVRAPWNEWADIVGEAQHTLTHTWAQAMYSYLGFDGGETAQQVSGANHAMSFKEAEVIGHPYVLIPFLLDQSGVVSENCAPTQSPDSDSDEPPPPNADCFAGLPGDLAAFAAEEAADSAPDPETGENPDWWEQSPAELAEAARDEIVETAGDYQAQLEACVNMALECVIGELLDSTEFRRIFSIIDTVTETVEAIQEITGLINTITEIVTLISSGGIPVPQPRIDRYLCPSQDPGITPELILPFTPYFLSGIDPAWRAGLIDLPPTLFPNDLQHFDTVINPLSDDGIGPDGELWGHMYPRSGYANHPHDAKAAMITIKRAIDIIHEPSRYRFRLNNRGFPPNEDNEYGFYQMIYPYETKQCALEPWDIEPPENIHGDFMYPGAEYRYAYNYWREHECPGTTRGSEIVTVDFGGDGICLIP